MDNAESTNWARTPSFLQDVHKRLKTCLLCRSKRIAVVAAFVPIDPTSFFGVPLEPKGAVFYLLCQRCIKKDAQTRNTLVEELLRLKLGASCRREEQTLH